MINFFLYTKNWLTCHELNIIKSEYKLLDLQKNVHVRKKQKRL